MGNAIDYVFMENYKSTRNLINVKVAINNAKSLKTDETILHTIPSHRNFTIKNNVAISEGKYIENELPISELLQLEGLNKCHCITISEELHNLIAKANLYASSTIY